ncbi:response regulator [Steroidobacter denitrificans]|uniref:hypothetical protein n=1 Tax=Steroidobacter denitrificans TaxID=465721 RepID=UPI001AEF3ED6|nr:hypothetical protein [Steroidobacter denitrificans]
MQGTRQDFIFAAPQAGERVPAQTLDIVLLTTDSGLLATLREASSSKHALWQALSADAAVDYLVGGRCNILIVDLDALPEDAAVLLERLHAQFPELVMMATGRREKESTVGALISGGEVYRFLHKPVSPTRAQLFLSAATRRCHELHNIEPIALTTVRTIAARRDLRGLTFTIAVVLTALVVYLILQLRDPQPLMTEHSSVQVPSVEEQIAHQLGRANIAYATGRLIEPRGDNALQYFREVLALQGDQPAALAGIDRIAVAMEIRFEEALKARDAPRAAAALMGIQDIRPQYPGLDELHTRLLTLSRSMGAATTPRSLTHRTFPTAPVPAQAEDEYETSAIDAEALLRPNTTPEPRLLEPLLQIQGESIGDLEIRDDLEIPR